MNPLVPAWSDVLLSAALMLHVVLVIVALTVLVRARPIGHVVLPILAIVFVPVAGPALWLFAVQDRASGTRARGEQIAPPPRA